MGEQLMTIYNSLTVEAQKEAWASAAAEKYKVQQYDN